MPKKTIQLDSISFEEIIIHTLPKHKKGQTDVSPKFSEVVSSLTMNLCYLFKDKIVAALRSDKAIKLLYDNTSLSPVSALAKSIINNRNFANKKDLVKDSKTIGQFLFDTQSGSNNEGILIVVPCRVNQKPALIMLKLEMDTGVQLIIDEEAKTFDVQEVEDLMMTKKTKVYKVALLLNKSLQRVPYDAIVSDNQIDTKAKEEVRTWFINKFLGCYPFQDPKITTQHFYNFTKAYIDTVEDDIKRTKYHQDLNSYMMMNNPIINPEDFANDYLSSTSERNSYRNYLLEKAFPFESFQKDTIHIEKRIHQMTMEFANQIVLTSKTGSFKGKVKFEKTEDGNTKAEIISRVKKVK